MVTERRLAGIAVSPGVAIGPVVRAGEAAVTVAPARITALQIEPEQARLEAAIQRSRKQLGNLRARLAMLPEGSQAEIAPLLDAYLHMIGPSRLTRGARARVENGLVSAETAVVEETEATAASILAAASRDDPGAAQRHADEVHEIGRRLVRNLTRTPFRRLTGLPAGSVLICETLRPADAALLDPSRLAGVATEEGSADGHTAVMLRALGLPAVLGAGGLAGAVAGTLAIVDGSRGFVTLHPSPASLEQAHVAVAAFARQRQSLGRLRRLPAVTADGAAVELQANLDLPAELPLVTQSGAAGIGLLRSEFLFINAETLPDEATQYETYRRIIAALGPDPVTIRVLDWGGEKESEAIQQAGLLPAHPEPNPALGLRGLRLLLRHPALLEVQLAAILRAALAGPTRVLLPMVTTATEIRATRRILERVARRLRRSGIAGERLPARLPPLGIMIETPAAALSADALALEADFFAIGTNDLTMYALAVDRAGHEVSALYDPLHPGVLRLVRFAIEAALRRHIPVSVCGELAANPLVAPLLLGMGLRSFSVNAGAVPRVKQAIRAARIDDCARFARRVMEESDPQRIHALLLGQPGP